jgi:hypothetical protein
MAAEEESADDDDDEKEKQEEIENIEEKDVSKDLPPGWEKHEGKLRRKVVQLHTG